MAHQQNQGVTARVVAPFSLDREVFVKLMNLDEKSLLPQPEGVVE
jgi:hypothetical protein